MNVILSPPFHSGTFHTSQSHQQTHYGFSYFFLQHTVTVLMSNKSSCLLSVVSFHIMIKELLPNFCFTGKKLSRWFFFFFSSKSSFVLPWLFLLLCCCWFKKHGWELKYHKFGNKNFFLIVWMWHSSVWEMEPSLKWPPLCTCHFGCTLVFMMASI